MKPLSFNIVLRLALTLLAAILWMNSARAQTVSAQAPAAATQEYLARAGMGDLFEVQTSKLALERAKAEPVKNFATMMVKDHTDSTKKLEAAAKSANISVAPPAKLDAAHQEKYDKLQKSDAASFDEAYIRAQLDAHDEALKIHQAYAKSGENAGLKAAAAEIVKVVEHHRMEAMKISAKPK